MPYNITSAITRGQVSVTSGPHVSPSPGLWLSEARDNVNSVFPSADVNSASAFIGAEYVNSFGSNYYVSNYRYFMAFDNSSVPVPVTELTLYIYCQSSAVLNLQPFMVVGSSAPNLIAGVNAGNYKAIPGLTDGVTMNGYVVDEYTAQPGSFGPTPSPSPYSPSFGWNAVPLGMNAAANFNGPGLFQIALVNYEYDYSYAEPPVGTAPVGTQIQIGPPSAYTYAPYLLANTSIGQWVLSINPFLTFKVNGVTGTNIEFVNRKGAIEIYRSTTGGVGGTFNPGCTYGNGPSIPIYTLKGMQALIGEFVYTDIGLTAAFNGGNTYWGVDSVGGATLGWGGDQWQISPTGQILAFDNCGF